MTACRICSLAADHPGVTLADDGVCNLCTLDVASELLENFAYTNAVFERFQSAGGDPSARYDCLFMFSGGKDSTYMLDKFVNEYGKRVLAYTFEVPFESVHAGSNMARVKERIAADFVTDADDRNIRRMMGDVFNRPKPAAPGRYLDEKLPCVSCRTFFVLRAILRAFEDGIPYIALCADPQQILTMESDVRKVVRGFVATFGRDLATELFDGRLDALLFTPDEDLPRIVFPFIAMRHEYDPEHIAEELRAKGLYTSSPMETHCTLFPLLNYYSFRNHGCMFYKLNAATHLRAVRRGGESGRPTFSIRFPRSADLPRIERELAELTFAIAAGRGEPARQEADLVDLFRRLEVPEDGARFVARSFLDMRRTADDLGVVLS